MEKTQMNIRVDAILKERGDASLAQAGYTPTQAVRALWAFAAAHAARPAAVRQALEALAPAEPDEAEEVERKRALARTGAALYRKARAEHDATDESCLASMSYDDLRWEAHAERMHNGTRSEEGAR